MNISSEKALQKVGLLVLIQDELSAELASTKADLAAANAQLEDKEVAPSDRA